MYTIYDELANLGKELDRTLNPGRRSRGVLNYPLTNIYENNDYVNVVAIVPGMKSEDIDIWFENGILKISGVKKDDRDAEKERFVRNEREFGKFVKSIRISESIDVNKISANYKNGILNIKLEKEEKAKPKKITIS